MEVNVRNLVQTAVLLLFLLEAVASEEAVDFCKTKPMSTNTSECCVLPPLFNHDVWKACAGIGENQSSPAEGVFTNLVGECIGDCVFQSLDFLNGSDILYEVLRERVIEYTKQNEMWAHDVSELIQNATMTIDKMHKADDPWQCDSKADMFIEYFYSLLLFNCPWQVIANSEICVDMNRRFKECPQKLHVPASSHIEDDHSHEHTE